MSDDKLNKRVSAWGKRTLEGGRDGLILAVDVINHMAAGQRDWDAAARFLQVTAPNPKKPDTANRVFRLLIAAYFGSSVKVTTAKTTGPGSHYTGYRFTMDAERCPEGEAVTPSNHWAFVEKAIADKKSITSAAFFAELRDELTGEKKDPAALDAATYAPKLAKRMIKDHVQLEVMIAQLRAAYKAEAAKTATTQSSPVQIERDGQVIEDDNGDKVVEFDDVKAA